MPEMSSPPTSLLGTYTTLFSGVFDMNSVADQPFTLANTVMFAQYVPLLVVASKASTAILLATGGIYTGPSKGGIAVVAASQVWTGLTSSSKVIKPPLTAAGQDLITGNTLYLCLDVAMGAPGTAFMSVMGLPG